MQTLKNLNIFTLVTIFVEKLLIWLTDVSEQFPVKLPLINWWLFNLLFQTNCSRQQKKTDAKRVLGLTNSIDEDCKSHLQYKNIPEASPIPPPPLSSICFNLLILHLTLFWLNKTSSPYSSTFLLIYNSPLMLVPVELHHFLPVGSVPLVTGVGGRPSQIPSLQLDTSTSATPWTRNNHPQGPCLSAADYFSTTLEVGPLDWQVCFLYTSISGSGLQ